MFRKEFKEATKFFFNFNRFFIGTTLLTLFIIKFVLATQVSLDEIIELLIHPVMLFQSFIMGATLFTREKTEGAFEYLYSLPLSRGKVIANKILSRLFYLLITLGIYTALALTAPSFKPIFKFPVIVSLYFSVFLLAASLSLNRRKGVASVFQSLFQFTCITAAFFYFFYLAVYWQFTFKEQPRYFKSANVFGKIVLEQPYGLIAAYFLFSLLLFAIFLFRFKRTDLKNQGALPVWKYIRFVPLFILVFIFAFFIQEYRSKGTESSVFKYELAGDLLLQSNGYDLFIHAPDSRYRLNLSPNGQGCRFFFHQGLSGKKYFLWAGRDFYHLETGSYALNKIYAMPIMDELLFIKNCGGKVYIGEAGWQRTIKKQLTYNSKLVTIDLESEKYSVLNVNLNEATPIFLYARDGNQGLILSEILTYDNGFIRAIDLKTGKVASTDMKLDRAIAAIKTKYPEVAGFNFTLAQHINRDRLMLGLKNSPNSSCRIFEISANGNIIPWSDKKYFPLNSDIDSDTTLYKFFITIRDEIFQEASLLNPSEIETDKESYADAIFWPVVRHEEDYSALYYAPFRIIGSNLNSEIYYYYPNKDSGYDFYKIQAADMVFIKNIPTSIFIKDNPHYLYPDSFFTSGSGVVMNFKRILDREPVLNLFMPWIKNYTVKVFTFPDLSEMDFVYL